jgi:hypothetical protein
MPLQVAELESIQQKNQDLGEALKKIITHINNLEKAVHTTGAGIAPAPSQIAQLTISAGSDGSVNYAINDPSVIGITVPLPIRYFIEWSTDPNFNPSNAQVQSWQVNAVRGSKIFVGAGSYYFRSYSQFDGSNPSPPTAFGGTTPTLVNVTNSNGAVPPAPLPPQGTGSGAPGIPASGMGNNPRYPINPVPRDPLPDQP